MLTRFKTKFKNTVKEQMLQGASRKGLASSIALAVMFGAFPVIGFTTIFCLLAGAAFKLNHPTIQITNYLMAPIQLALMPVFLRVGEFVFNSPPLPLEKAFLGQYGVPGGMAVFAWLLVIPWIGIAVFFIAHSILRKFPSPQKA